MWVAGALVKLAKHRKPLWVWHHGTKVLLDDPLIHFRIIDMLLRGVYEADEVRAINALTQRGYFGPQDRVLELGSGAGVVALQIVKRVGPQNYIGYEANDAVLALARRNFELNGWTVEFRRRLLLPQPETARTFAVQANYLASGLQEQVAPGTEARVDADGWDTVMAAFAPTILVMDIEGAERELIDGVEDFSCLRALVMENHYVGERRPVFEAMKAKLAAKGLREAPEIFVATNVHVFVRQGPA